MTKINDEEFEILPNQNTTTGSDIDGDILVKKADVDNLNEKINDLSDDNDKLKKKKMEKNVISKKAKILMSVFGGVAAVGIAGGITGIVLSIESSKPPQVEGYTINFVSEDEQLGTLSGKLTTTIKEKTKCKDINFPRVKIIDTTKTQFKNWYIEGNDNPITDDTEIDNNCKIIAKFNII